MNVFKMLKVRLLRRQAEQGDVEAMTCLGVEYLDQKNYEEAIRWWRKAAEQNFPGAQVMLGAAFDYGNGVKQDKGEAVRWYRMAADQGDITAQSALGSNYLLGEGVAKDISEGIRWHQKAAEQGDRSAQMLLGGLYANSDFVPNDKVEAVRWYSSAFKASSLTRSLAKENAVELKWFLWAAEEGDGDVLLNVGNIYSSSGGGVPQNDAEALRWYRMAADKGNEEALCLIAHMYENGKGVPQDYAEAMRCYRTAAEKGNAGAMFNIGMMYNRSEGVPIDPHELYFWFYLCSTYPVPQSQASHVTKSLEVLTTKIAAGSVVEIRARAKQWIETHPKIHFRND
jgi:TPR repeat protein